MRRASRISTQTIALCGILAAVALVLLFAAGMTPTGWMGVTAVAGLAVAVAVSAAGYVAGVMCWLVSGILSLLLVPGKHVAVLFLCLFGVYPVLKNLFERIRRRALEYLVKLAYFNLVFFGLYTLAYGLFFEGAAKDWTLPVPFVPVIWVLANLVFLVYDFAFAKVMAMLQVRLVPLLRRRFCRR